MTKTTAREWTHEDRPELNRRGLSAPGPWDDEPDKRHWVDPETDLDCLMLRNHFGAWCGYVAVTEGHLFFEVDYDGCPDNCGEDWCYKHTPNAHVEVHGGLTFANFCHESEKGEGYGICHTPLDGRPERVWWLGFDCNHAGDLSPYDVAEMASGDSGYASLYKRDDTYRTVPYVQAECEDLARQLKALVP